MYKHGILKVLSASPTLQVGNPRFNAKEIKKVLLETKASLALFPELALTGYTCGDMFYQESLIKSALNGLQDLLELKFYGIVVVGMPLDIDGILLNTAVVFKEDKILGVVPKTFLPNTDEFQEKRWFSSGIDINMDEVILLGQKVPFGHLLFVDEKSEIRFGVEICQDMWAPVSPGNLLSLAGANMILNLSASNVIVGKEIVRKNTVLEHSRKNQGAYIYTSSGMSESSSETIFSGHNIHASMGELINEKVISDYNTEYLISDIDFKAINFQRRKDSNIKDTLHQFDIKYKVVYFTLNESTDFEFSHEVNTYPFIDERKETFEEIRTIQTRALAKRLIVLNYPKIIIGVSGGLDSTLALLVAVDTFNYLNRNLKDIVGLSLPGLGSSKRTMTNAKLLATKLGITFNEIDIKEESYLHFEKIEQDAEDFSVTYENTQARIRTMTLMNLANKLGGIVLGTGDLTEVALGFMTYSGDQMSMYGINGGIPKTLVQRQTLGYKNVFPELKDIIDDILDTPISPELIKEQKTEDILGNFQINDYLLYRHLVCGDHKEKLLFMLNKVFHLEEYDANKSVTRFLNRFYKSQFKRQVLPDGPKVLKLGLSPRGDYRRGSDVGIEEE